MKKVINSKGRLTSYGFACGYIEKSQNNEIWKEIYKESGVFHVRAGKIGKGFEIWDSFESKQYKDAVKRYNNIKSIK